MFDLHRRERQRERKCNDLVDARLGAGMRLSARDSKLSIPPKRLALLLYTRDKFLQTYGRDRREILEFTIVARRSAAATRTCSRKLLSIKSRAIVIRAATLCVCIYSMHYVDLDEFLSENGIPVDGTNGGPGAQNQPGNGGGGGGLMHPGQLHKLGGGGGGQNDGSASNGHQGPAGLHLEPITKRERSPSPSECCSPDTLNPPSPADSTLSMASSGRDFDPRTRAFSDEELKPQPMIKKSRKQFVPDDLKDDKYWARRRKNNMAAKRSRDARRMKENQIALRAGFLEKENMGLRQELDRLKSENSILRDKLSKYTDV
ncbi:unnamed protein product [Trichogramma brassicae]|uniref:BZIP domain-containing protein n=1 Tax=Trichogramma brassicae TaxID=86971 RepID=A0A6H5IKB7_9HYME|nr:unnamed protein product [Trichogramma brassicae]